MDYDKNNIFAKILRGEIPCNKVYENKYVLAFHDVNPQKKVHVLVIPKGSYINLNDFNKNASNIVATPRPAREALITIEFRRRFTGRKSINGSNKNGIWCLSSQLLIAWLDRQGQQAIIAAWA